MAKNLIGLLLMFSALRLEANEITVISGEHGNFSRLVVVSDAINGWSSTQLEDGYRIKFDGDNIVLDTTEVFRTIPRNRVKLARSAGEGAELLLDLNCDCPVRTFTEGNSVYVIDILDPEQKENRNSSRNGHDFNIALSQGTVQQIARPLDFEVELSENQETDVRVLTAAGSEIPIQPVQEEANGDLESSIIQNIFAASSHNLLQPDKEVAATYSEETNASPIDNLIVRERRIATETDKEESIGNCILSPLLDLSASENPDRRLDHVSRARQLLSDDSDGDRDSTYELSAHLYLKAGLGLEARQILQRVRNQSRRTEMMFTLSEIIEYGEARSSHSFSEQYGCTNSLALWAVLSGTLPDEIPEESRKAALRAFFELPVYLRTQVAQQFALGLETLGHTEDSELIKNSLPWLQPSEIGLAAPYQEGQHPPKADAKDAGGGRRDSKETQ